MPSRRLHPKTRHGCPQCKARRVKCDEKRPQCGNCQRYGSKCDFAEIEHPAAPLDKRSLEDAGTASQIEPKNKREWVWAPTMSAAPLASPRGPMFEMSRDNIYQLPLPTVPNLNLHDLEIFNHYAAYTSASLSDRDSIQLTWRVAVPKEAIPHDFLTHALLSFASAHLAQLCPAQRTAYGRGALVHRNIALRSCIPSLRKITPKNCHALFAFSSVIAVSTFAFPDMSSESDFNPVDNVLTFLVLIRGVNTVLQGGLDWIKSGSLNPLLQDGRVNWREQVALLPVAFLAPFERLRVLNENTTPDTNVRKIYAEAIQDLENSYGAYQLIASDRSLVFIWCAIIPSEYVALLRERQPMALVVLAHFAVLLHNVGAQWWAGPRGRHLAEAIHNELDNEWKSAVEWPMAVVQSPWPA